MSEANYMQVVTCPGENHCWHRSNTVLTMNPPIPVDVCCNCGRQLYRYDLQHHAMERPKGHGPHAPQ